MVTSPNSDEDFQYKRRKSLGEEYPTTYKRKPTKSHERMLLQRAFVANECPTTEEVLHLATQLGWDPKRVKQWFSNRRSIKKRETFL
jgi:hypothetical protein